LIDSETGDSETRDTEICESEICESEIGDNEIGDSEQSGSERGDSEIDDIEIGARERGDDEPGIRRLLPAGPRLLRTSCAENSNARTIRPLGTHRLLEQTLTAFHGVLHPTTLAEAGSDQHWGYLPQLCCAFGLSQPLDALFRLQPLRPCFMPVTPLGFRLPRFSLPGSQLHLSVEPSLHAVVMTGFGVCQDGSLPSPDFEGLRIRGVRTARPVLPGTRRPILA
jgi:hypothetical protein